MKKKDIGVVAVIAIVSAMFSYFMSSALISSPEDRQQSVEVVESVVAEFTQPDKRYFNQKSVNPTKTIIIAPVDNPNPFQN